MKQKIFGLWNKVYERYDTIFNAPSAGLWIRDNSQFFAKVNPHFTEDCELVEFGDFDDSKKDFSPILGKFEVVSWDSYKQPEVVADKASPEDFKRKE